MNNFFSFIGGDAGQWMVTGITTVVGEPLKSVKSVKVENVAASELNDRGSWVLQGFVSNIRYAERHEVTQLRAKQEGLNRPDATCAALIPIKKSEDWWALAQDERRHIFESQSRHTAIGLDYLPQISRQLHHCRDLSEPFDFLTWFEFAPEHTAAFDKLVLQLRASEEWKFVVREIDIRLEKTPG